MSGNTLLDFNPPIQLVRELMLEYAAQLGIDLSYQNFQAELAGLPGCYSGPQGCLVVAFTGDAPAGCGAARPLSPHICEMKRLYIRPAFRGKGLGRKLAVALMDHARAAGFESMRLDTLSSMKSAIALYESLGFHPIAPYNYTPLLGGVFLEASLKLHRL